VQLSLCSPVDTANIYIQRKIITSQQLLWLPLQRHCVVPFAMTFPINQSHWFPSWSWNLQMIKLHEISKGISVFKKT
jgi:hypothetical protein